MRAAFLGILVFTLTIVGCKKDPVYFGDNDPPYYQGIADVLIENYVNRVFIDLIGREPLDGEMIAEVNALKAANLSMESREALLTRLQTDESFIAGDGSYKQAYYQRIYDLSKARFMEAASDVEIDTYKGILQNRVNVDSAAGIWDEVEFGRAEIAKLDAVLNSNEDYRNGIIEIKDVCGAMINNEVYDDINMNTFNFVNASFDNMFFRFPTQVEFFAGFNMIEDNSPSSIFGVSGQNKDDYIGILNSSREFYQGMIIWVYQQALAREPSAEEVALLMEDFYVNHDLQDLQIKVLKTDEYAQFD
ncbi:MAG: hypothetical protein ACI9FU_001372 [Granulosicoccus sp.]|jgi:hypothetical protein